MRRAEHISRRLKFRHLNVLLSVVEKGRMAKVAKQLGISQPVVSKAKNELEQMLGVRFSMINGWPSRSDSHLANQPR